MQQLSLTLEADLAQRYRDMRECFAACVYQRGLVRVAGQIDMAPSKLSEKLSGGNDRKRDIGCDDLETYIANTNDTTPIYYLIDKFLRDPALSQQEALARLASFADMMPSLMAAAGLSKGKRA